MLPGASGLRIIINRSAICDWDICLDSSSAEAVSSYLRSALSDTQNPLVAALRGQNSSRYREEGMWEQVGRLHSYHGDVPAEIRLLKLTEEVGEAAEALIGMQGLNSRKGTCRTRDDLLAELADVIITAAVAMSGIAGDVDEARSHLERRLAVVSERAGL
jgi:NTP pyrophosphatase (non-canonical NTP hydrolase)